MSKKKPFKEFLTLKRQHMVEGSLHKVTEPPWEGRESVVEHLRHLHPVGTLEWGSSEGGPGKVAFLPQQVQLAGREVGY